MPGGEPFHFALALVAILAVNADVDAQGLASFSATLDRQWNYNKPADSEALFRRELANWSPDDPQALIVNTQIARTYSLRGQWSEAHATLDAIESKLATSPSHVRVRYLLERGRAFNSSGDASRAVPLFAEALSLAECNHDDFYAVDAAHMLGIAAPVEERHNWNLKALAMTERATDPRTRRWLAPLYNNIGQTHLEQGDYAKALDYFRKALPAWEERGDDNGVRIARWMIARAQRSLGQLDDAERTQLALLAEYNKIGETDGYVFEELTEIALLRNDTQAAKQWALKAHAALKSDQGLAAREPRRLERLASIAGGNTSQSKAAP